MSCGTLSFLRKWFMSPAAATAAKSLQSCPSLCDPTDGSPRPWDSPGKNTGVGCHFLLQCMKVKSESEVTQSCPTLSDPMDCSPPGSSIHGIFRVRVLEWGAIAFSVVLPALCIYLWRVAHCNPLLHFWWLKFLAAVVIAPVTYLTVVSIFFVFGQSW